MDEISLTRLGQAALYGALLACLCAMALCLGVLSQSLGVLLSDTSRDLLAQPQSMVFALLLGIAVTIMLQSSSLASVLIVNLVATSQLPTQAAIAAIFGANIGTVLTPMLLSLVLRSSAARTVAWQHALFNLAGAATLLPIELVFHPLYHLASWIAQPETPHAGLELSIGTAAQPIAMALSVGGLIALMFCVRAIAARLLRGTGHDMNIGDTTGVAIGVLSTMVLQLSAATIACTCGVAASGALSSRRSIAIVLGANIGTTFTAVLAALALDGPLREIALVVALVHLLYNVIGTLVVLLIPPIRGLLVRLATALA
ncbi:Na/Pi cotransporter family protein [Corynebacterium pelargi]|uniref:Na+/Pi-cotransporter n=1 Tax=Corynebacterium pelargi TaxID=1471400 RepID=A0A410W701_9CORY|nr:Na/Pi cotransporter family protein [Corynebacterium pelargi]QAU51597.1 Na+/Pi-cotransporter [Corynebacterium pelargi]GGG79922.1 sodium:phosphate symporter [Corynebacterium pelargi]